MDRTERYRQTLAELFDLQRFSIKMGLENITRLCGSIGNPQRCYPSIHVAGTNGKGSTSIIIQKILVAHGLKTGLYTSPHLVDFSERIRVDQNLIDPDFISDFWSRISAEVKAIKATFFDTTTAMAFQYFENRKVDVAVIETGLGGRLDSTNILQPDAVVITPIDIDHVKQLGADVVSIAGEKAAIIKKGTVLFTAEQFPQVEKVLDEYRRGVNGDHRFKRAIAYKILDASPEGMVFDFLDRVRRETYPALRLNLLGEFQVQNALLAYLCARWYLEKRKIQFDSNRLYRVLDQVQWPGRLERVSTRPLIYFDVSHNYAGFKSTLDFIRAHVSSRSRILLLGLLADKEFERIVPLVASLFDRIILTEPDNERKLDAELLAGVFASRGSKVTVIKEMNTAFDSCIRKIGDNDILFVMGSHYLVGELSKRLQEKSLTSRK